MLHLLRYFFPRNSQFFTDKTQETHTAVPVSEDEQQTVTKHNKIC